MTRRRRRIAPADLPSLRTPIRQTIPAGVFELDDAEDGYHHNREALHEAAADLSSAAASMLDALRSYPLDAPKLSRREREQLERAAALFERIEDRIENDRAAHGDQSDRFGDIAQNIAARSEREQAGS